LRCSRVVARSDRLIDELCTRPYSYIFQHIAYLEERVAHALRVAKKFPNQAGRRILSHKSGSVRGTLQRLEQQRRLSNDARQQPTRTTLISFSSRQATTFQRCYTYFCFSRLAFAATATRFGLNPGQRRHLHRPSLGEQRSNNRSSKQHHCVILIPTIFTQSIHSQNPPSSAQWMQGYVLK